MNTTALKSSTRREAEVGRRPAENPLSVQLSFRIDDATAEQLDEELKKAMEMHPGLVLSRGDVARMLMAEALKVRRSKPSKK